MINKAVALWKLPRIIGKSRWEKACEINCRNAYLHGYLDQMLEDREISVKIYYQGKECIKALGKDNFALSFESRFGKQVPINSHLLE